MNNKPNFHLFDETIKTIISNMKSIINIIGRENFGAADYYSIYERSRIILKYLEQISKGYEYEFSKSHSLFENIDEELDSIKKEDTYVSKIETSLGKITNELIELIKNIKECKQDMEKAIFELNDQYKKNPTERPSGLDRLYASALYKIDGISGEAYAEEKEKAIAAGLIKGAYEHLQTKERILGKIQRQFIESENNNNS